jgi:hypothetical protein
MAPVFRHLSVDPRALPDLRDHHGLRVAAQALDFVAGEG